MDGKKFVGAPIFYLLLSCMISFSSAKYVIRLRGDLSQCPVNQGYFRDESDCRKFYRCTENPTPVLGQKYMTRSEFNCPPGTIFDETLSICNHVMFVHNIPPGCDVSGAIVPQPGKGSSSSSSSTSTTVKTTTATSSISSHIESTTPAPVSMGPPSGIHLGQQPQLPLKPENIQNIPIVTEEGDQQQPMFPSINPPLMPGGGGDQQQPMFPSINPPLMPGGGGDQQQPMFPSINPPLMPGGGGDQQQPMFPSINPPLMPGGGGGDQQQPLPMFPSINFPNFPGSQQPMIPGSIPSVSVPSGGQHQQSLVPPPLSQQLPNKDRDHRQQQALIPSLPSFNLPSVPGSPKLPQLTFPSNLEGILMLPNGQQQTQNQNNQQTASSPEQSLQNLASSSATTITTSSNGQSENKPTVGGWITPQQFPEQQHTPVKPMHHGDSGGWVVPDNFPTFYTAFSRGSPILFSSFTSNPSPLILT